MEKETTYPSTYGIQYTPHSDETDLIRLSTPTEAPVGDKKQHRRIPSYKEMLKNIAPMEYPWNRIASFY